jgi:ribosome-associated translation inhibitor RaiA
MRVEAQFVNFPKSRQIRLLLEQKIAEILEKYSQGNAFVRVFFSLNGVEHHVKISVVSGKLNLCVQTNSYDIVHCVDKVLHKLDAALRKATQKHKRARFTQVAKLFDLNAKYQKHVPLTNENIFDKYESHYAANFDEHQTSRIWLKSS